MSNKIFVLILIWTLVGALWLWAAPTENPPGGGGLIKWQKSAGRILISTSTRWAATTPTAIINFNSQIVTGVPDPIDTTDAVNKNYADQNYGGANTTRLWGQGRVGNSDVININGECKTDTNRDGTDDTKVSRSKYNATWDGAAAICPKGWWVCKASERDDNGATAGYGACGSGNHDYEWCDTGGNADEFALESDDNAWVSNQTSGTGLEWRRGMIISAGGSENNTSRRDKCSIRRVWCCKKI